MAYLPTSCCLSHLVTFSIPTKLLRPCGHELLPPNQCLRLLHNELLPWLGHLNYAQGICSNRLIILEHKFRSCACWGISSDVSWEICWLHLPVGLLPKAGFILGSVPGWRLSITPILLVSSFQFPSWRLELWPLAVKWSWCVEWETQWPLLLPIRVNMWAFSVKTKSKPFTDLW